MRDVPVPTCGARDLRVRVRAAALNRADLLQRRGLYPAPSDVSADVPGLEFAGEVVERGGSATEFPVGSRVMGIVGGGSHAEYVRIDSRTCLAVPDRLDWVQAAAVPEAHLTAFDALFELGRLEAGQHVLIHAAGSGVGTAAVQMARDAGAHVVGLSRTAKKRARLESLGVTTSLDPDIDGIAASVVAATAGHGVDVVLDLVGAAAMKLNLEVIAPRGRIVAVGLLGGARATVDLARLLTRRVTLVGTVLRSRQLDERIELAHRYRQTWLPRLADGRIVPVVDRTFSMRDVAEAHAYMERNENFGKIVLVVGDDGGSR